MNRHRRRLGIVIPLCAFIFCLFAGCSETCKGMQRDWQTLSKVDAWFKEHYW